MTDPAAPTSELRTDVGGFLDAASFAVLGASERWATAKLMRNLLGGGARVVGVHPSRTEVLGVRCVPSLQDAGETPDVVVSMLGAANTLAAVEDALQAGARRFVVPGLGIESGPGGAEVRTRLTALLHAHDAALVGPNCMGYVVPGRPSPWIGTVVGSVRPGTVGTLVQSGSIGEALVSMGPRVGLRAVVSGGNEPVRDAADWTACFADDPATRAIGLFLEAVRRPAAFEDALRRAAEAGKPVVVLKVGRSAAAARNALAHSGAIVGSDRAFDALCRAYGAVRVDDYADWLEHLEVFGAPRRPRGTRLVALTNSGGEGELLADLAEAAGIPFPPLPEDLAAALDARFPYHGASNPLDYWAVAEHGEIVPGTVGLCARHPEVDGVLLNVDQSWRFEDGEREGSSLDAGFLARAVEETGAFCALVSTATSDPQDDVLHTAAAAGYPVLVGGAQALRAIAAAARWAPRTRPEAEPAPAVAAPELEGRGGALPERESKELLGRYGVEGTREARATSVDEAVDAARALGHPVVVKSDGPAHKERAGGVVLGCGSDDAVREAALRIGGPVLVAEDLRGGVEVLAGLVRDPQVGALVVCGVGGAWAEPLAASARTALAPLPQAEAVALVRDVAPLAARLDDAGIEAVARVLVALGRAAADHPAIAEIDLNPLRVADGRAIALDALVVVAQEAP